MQTDIALHLMQARTFQYRGRGGHNLARGNILDSANAEQERGSHGRGLQQRLRSTYSSQPAHADCQHARAHTWSQAGKMAPFVCQRGVHMLLVAVHKPRSAATYILQSS